MYLPNLRQVNCIKWCQAKWWIRYTSFTIAVPLVVECPYVNAPPTSWQKGQDTNLVSILKLTWTGNIFVANLCLTSITIAFLSAILRSWWGAFSFPWLLSFFTCLSTFTPFAPLSPVPINWLQEEGNKHSKFKHESIYKTRESKEFPWFKKKGCWYLLHFQLILWFYFYFYG